EDTGDWDQAYNYRIMLSKVAHENQAETVSHILVQKAKSSFDRGDWGRCHEDLDDAFRFAPSVSAKILRLRLLLVEGSLEQAEFQLLELVKEHPMYTSFIFESLNERVSEQLEEDYRARLVRLRGYFLDLEDDELMG